MMDHNKILNIASENSLKFQITYRTEVLEEGNGCCEGSGNMMERPGLPKASR